MSDFKLTPLARQDLLEIQSHFRAVSERLADHVVDQLIAMMQDLAENPGMGHRRDDLTPRDLRFQAVFRYLIVYRDDHDPITIVRIVHASRDVIRELKG